MHTTSSAFLHDDSTSFRPGSAMKNKLTVAALLGICLVALLSAL